MEDNKEENIDKIASEILKGLKEKLCFDKKLIKKILNEISKLEQGYSNIAFNSYEFRTLVLKAFNKRDERFSVLSIKKIF